MAESATRPKAYLVLGDQNVGKSTLVRHLTGVQRDRIISLATDEGEIGLRAVVSSVNERENPPEPNEWAKEIRKAARDYSHIILPLRYESKRKNPPAEAYYRAHLASPLADEMHGCDHIKHRDQRKRHCRRD